MGQGWDSGGNWLVPPAAPASLKPPVTSPLPLTLGLPGPPQAPRGSPAPPVLHTVTGHLPNRPAVCGVMALQGGVCYSKYPAAPGSTVVGLQKPRHKKLAMQGS